MTDIAETARQFAINCEVRKWAYRQTKDGIVVSFLLHPQEVPEGLAVAPLGTRYVLAMVEVDDNEQPVERKVVPAESNHQPLDTAPASAMPPDKPARAHKPVAAEKRLTQRAAILCTDPLFHAWLRETNSAWRIMREGTDEDRAAAIVRAKCHVKSRTEIVPGTTAAEIFDDMVSRFTAWKIAPEMTS